MPLNGQTERSTTVDISRGFARLLVLYCHALEISVIERSVTPGLEFSQWKFVHSFNMPLFFVISGMLFRVRSFREVWANSLTLLFIAYGTHLVGWALKAVLHAAGQLGGVNMFASISFHSLSMPILQNHSFSVGVVWFIVALAFVQVIYHLLHVSRNIWRIWIVAALFASFSISQITERNDFQIASLLPGTLFYAIGVFLVRFDLTKLGLSAGLGALALVMMLAPVNQGCLLSAGDRCGIERLNGEFAAMMIDGKFGFLPAYITTATLGSLGIVWCANAIASRFELSWAPLSRIGAVHLFLLNGFVQQFVQPVIRVLFVSDEDAAFGIGVAWAVGLTMAQIAIMPIASAAVGPLVDGARRLARTLVMEPRKTLRTVEATRG